MYFLILAALLALPGYAVYRLGWNYQWVGAYTLTIGAVTYWVYCVDKRRAEDGFWRIPEFVLHALEIVGGWPGAFLAQRRVRHKCSKVSYQIVFWIIVLAYQFAAFDSYHGWEYSRMIRAKIEQGSSRK